MKLNTINTNQNLITMKNTLDTFQARYVIKLASILLLILVNLIALSQEIDFEINIVDDSLNITSNSVIETESGFLWRVRKATLYEELNYYTDFLYSVDKQGDTNIARIFSRPDTIFNYFDFIKINLGEPGYLLSGLLESLEEPDKTYTIFTRLDENLNTVWEKLYKYNYNYSDFKIRTLQLVDSSFLYGCSTQGTSIMYFQKLGYNGDSLSYRAYVGDSAGRIRSLTYNTDSTAFWVHNNWAHYPGMWFSYNSCVELDSALNQQTVYQYPEYYIDQPFTTRLLPDDGVISAGSSAIYFPEDDHREWYISLYKFDSEFNVLKTHQLTNPDTVSRAAINVSIDYCYPDCIYAGGTHNSQGAFQGNEPSWFFVTRLNEEFEIQYEKYIGGDDYYAATCITASEDGGVLVSGIRARVGAPMYHRDAYLIKLDSSGCITNLPEGSTIQIKDALVYPNPGTDKLMVRTVLKNCTLQLINVSGQIVLNQPINDHFTTLNTSLLKPGTYLYSINRQGRFVESGKWIKQNF
jgi:hypothetical protein